MSALDRGSEPSPAWIGVFAIAAPVTPRAAATIIMAATGHLCPVVATSAVAASGTSPPPMMPAISRPIEMPE
jgi:hypothetical protein